MRRNSLSNACMILSASCALAIAGLARAQSCTPQWLSGGMPVLNGTAFSAVMWDRDGAGPLPPALVVGGSFTLAGSTVVSNLALWDGVAWFDVGGGVSGSLHGATVVNALVVAPNGDLVVGGAFDDAGPSLTAANCIARYNGSTWSRMGQGVWRNVDTVQSLTIRDNGDIVALGGLFLNTDNSLVGPLVKWNDSTAPLWRDLATSAPVMQSYRTVLAVPGGDVIAGGVAGAASGSSAVWRWSDSLNTWLPYGSGVNGQILSLLRTSNGDLVVAGSFSTAGGTPASSIARWNGSSFSALGSGITNPSQPSQLAVRALAQMPGGDIVAGGQFDTAGGNPGGRIARWDGATWTRLPQGAGDIVWSLLLTPQNELVIGGAYTFAGGSFSNKRIARYTDSPSPWAARHPSPQSLADEATVTLSANCATGFSSVSFHWQRNGVDIASGPGGASPGGGNVSGASGALESPTTGSTVTLTITGAKAGDSGLYRVVFTNACGSGPSSQAAVTIAPPPCPADFDGDGTVDFFDYDAFVICFEGGPCPPGKTADFDNDGTVDFFDYDAFVVAFESPC